MRVRYWQDGVHLEAQNDSERQSLVMLLRALHLIQSSQKVVSGPIGGIKVHDEDAVAVALHPLDGRPRLTVRRSRHADGELEQQLRPGGQTRQDRSDALKQGHVQDEAVRMGEELSCILGRTCQPGEPPAFGPVSAHASQR